MHLLLMRYRLTFFPWVRVVAGLALLVTAHTALAQLQPGTVIRVLPPDGLVIDGAGNISGGALEVRDPQGLPQANVALTRTRIDSAGVAQGSAGGLLTGVNGLFNQGSLSWGTQPQALQGGSNRYCLVDVPQAEAAQACVDVTVLGTVITTVQGVKAYTVGGAAPASAALVAAARANTASAMQGMRIQLDHAQARMRALRLADHADWVNDTTVRINGRTVPASSAPPLTAPADTAPDANRNGALSAYVMGTLAVEEARNGGALKVQTDGVSIGTDYRLSRRAVWGASLGQARTSSDALGVSDAQTAHGTSLTLYGSFEPAAPWYIDAALSFARNDFAMKRNTSTGGQARADTTGTGTGISLTAGYQSLGQATVVSPYARLESLHVRVKGYTETGDTPYTVEGQSLRATAMALGTEAQFIMATRYAIVVPHARVELQHQTQQGDGSLSTSLVGTTTQLVTDTSVEVDRNFGLWSLGLSAQFKRGVAAFIDYEQLFSKSDAKERRLNLGLKLEF
ncbi:MAG: autotransporter outer membrane beta-barrel domain-containing protein [Rhizobacter sp.]